MISPSLLDALLLENKKVNDSMASDPDSDGTRETKTYASRKLNALVPEAIDTLELGLNTGQPGDRIKAANSILDHAPSTSPAATSSPPAPSLPLEAIALIGEAMSKMFSSLVPAPAAERTIHAETSFETKALVPIPREAPLPCSSGSVAPKPKGRKPAASRKPSKGKSK